MALETVTWPNATPANTDAVDGPPSSASYHMGLYFGVESAVSCAGIAWRVPDTVVNPDNSDAPNPDDQFYMTLWEAFPSTVQIKKQIITPVGGGVEQFLWTGGPVALDPAKDYVAAITTNHYSFRGAGGVWNFTNPGGQIVALAGRLVSTGDPDTFPANPFDTYYYISPLVGESEGPTYSPVTSTLTSKWRIYGQATSTLASKWRIYGPVSSSLTAKWRIFQGVTSSLTAKWRILGGVVSTLAMKWRIYDQVTSIFKAKWKINGEPVTPPATSSLYLTAQRAATAAFIADDPTTAELIPVVRVRTPSGGYTNEDQPSRAAQTFKLSLLGYDQRPTVTLAGVERLADYHLIGPHDMQIAVGDYWVDDEGTRFEVVGLTEGWNYMTKAVVIRHIPREAKP